MNRLILSVFAVSLVAMAGCVSVSHSDSGQNSTTSTFAGFEQAHNQGPGGGQWQGVDKLTLTYRIKGQNAVLDSDRLTLIFPNLPSGELHSFSFQGGELHIQIGGGGISESNVSCRRNNDASTFRSRYENGTNTIQFFGRTVKLANQARTIIRNNTTVTPAATDSSNSKQVVHVR